tara:strand:- start:282 stop:608 length:327 start_codon:yes stop_codon:yes gene_type:complete
MDNERKYGNLTKRIIFTDTDHRHAQLLIKLRYDGLKQSEFFRHIVSGYIADDPRIDEFMEKVKTQSIKKKNKSRKLKSAGIKSAAALNLDNDEIENIFDLLAEEYPDL